MRSLLFLLMGLGLGLATMIYTTGGVSSSPPTAPIGVVEAAAGQESNKPLGPQDLIEEAEIYDKEADQIQRQVMEYKKRAAAITPLMDPKGFRRAGLTMAAAAQSEAVAELRQLAAHHRTEAKRLMATGSSQ